MSKKEDIPIFNIKKIKEFSFTVNESLGVPTKTMRVQFQHNTAFDEERNLIDLTLRVSYYYDPIDMDALLVDIQVANIFEVSNLKKYIISDKGFVLPKNLITSMVSVAISHTRALLSVNTCGTIYQENILPIVNPIEVASNFYPNMFSEYNSDNREK